MSARSPTSLWQQKQPIGSSTTLGGGTISEYSADPLVSGSGLACRRGNEWLFRNLEFRVGKGRLTWLRGHNGSGKTTLLRIVAGLSAPDHGQVVFHGVARPADARRVYIGHANGLKDDLTVLESLRFLAGLHGQPSDAESADAALKRLGMFHRRRAFVRTLSQGQRRRVALARLALEQAPDLWVLDEPYDALDTAGIDTVDVLLREHLARGGGVLLTSHLELGAKAPAADVLELGKGEAF